MAFRHWQEKPSLRMKNNSFKRGKTRNGWKFSSLSLVISENCLKLSRELLLNRKFMIKIVFISHSSIFLLSHQIPEMLILIKFSPSLFVLCWHSHLAVVGRLLLLWWDEMKNRRRLAHPPPLRSHFHNLRGESDAAAEKNGDEGAWNLIK